VLRPSYSELIDILNNEKNVDSEITSRYTIVLAVAKRARQIIEGSTSLVNVPTDRAVSTAVKELAEGRLRITLEKDDTDIYAERATQQYYKGFSAVSKDDLREDFKDKYEPDKLPGEEDDVIGDEDEDEDAYKDDYKDREEDEDEEDDYALDAGAEKGGADGLDADYAEEVPMDDEDYQEDFNDFDDEEE